VRVGIWELLIIAVIIVLLFNTKRLARLGQAFRRSKTEYRRGVEEGLEEPQDVEFRDLSEDAKKVSKKSSS
jgi:Sec-independent protein translocase protein TatA